MSEIIAFRRISGSGGGKARLDQLTVQVATCLWRHGGRASLQEIAPMLAMVAGNRGDLSSEELDALGREIAARSASRELAGDDPLIVLREVSNTWELSAVARTILGPTN